MTKNEYDLIVIGADGAGSTAAGNAAESDKHVALIERDKLGGTCLNYGCDPTKILLHTASVLYYAQHATGLGLRIPQAKVDWDAVQMHVRQVQDAMAEAMLPYPTMAEAVRWAAYDTLGNAKKKKALKVIITNGVLLDEAIQIPDAFDSEILEKQSPSESLAVNDSPGG